MSGLKKLGIKVAVTLLFSVFVLAGLNMTQAYGQPLDSPLYSNTNAKVVEAMNGSDVMVQDTNVSPNGITSTSNCFCSLHCPTINNPPCVESVPVMSIAREFVYILALTGGACWAIIRKKRPKESEE